jgi:hypothetical protein
MSSSLEFCPPLLICDVRRFQSVRDSVVFVMMVFFLVDLSGSVLLGPLLGWHRELFFGWNTVGANVGGSEKSDGIPEPKSQEQVHESYDQETKNLRKLVLTSKVVNPFTCAIAPPFIGRRRDFYIPKIPSNIRNIPSVNTYINVFYIPWFAGLISHIYKPNTSSHVKPRLLKQRLWLGFLLVFESLTREDIHTSRLPNLDYSRFPNFADPRFQSFTSSWFQSFASSWFRRFAGSWF